MGFLLYVTCYFSLAAFNILFLCLVFVSLISVSWLVSPWVYPVWDSLCLLDLIGYFLFHVGEIFNYNLFKNFLIPFIFLCFFCCCKVTSVVSDSVRPHRHSPPGSPVPGILQARTLEWVALSFSIPYCRQTLYRLSHQGSPKMR